MSEEGMTDIDLGPAAEDPLSLLGAVRRAPPPPLPATRAAAAASDRLAGDDAAQGPRRQPQPAPAKPVVVRKPPAKPVKPVVSPRQPQRDWASLLGFEGAAVQPLSPSTASDELKRRASTAPAHTALNACAKGGSLDAVVDCCSQLRRRRLPRFGGCCVSSRGAGPRRRGPGAFTTTSGDAATGPNRAPTHPRRLRFHIWRRRTPTFIASGTSSKTPRKFS